MLHIFFLIFVGRALFPREERRICLILSLLLILTGSRANAQTKQIDSGEQFWTGYFNQARFNIKWGLWLDAQFRTQDDFFNSLFQAAGRIGLTYYLTNDARITGGYAYFNHFLSGDHESISQPEHRLWQQAQWQNSYPKLKLGQRIRLEQRWRRKVINNDSLADGFNFNYRMRYSVLAQFPLSKKRFQPHTLSFVVTDEILINFGKQIIYNYFDQNRIFLGFAYYVNRHDNIQFGYMNVFQQLSSGNRYRSNNVVRLFYFHNLDLRRQSALIK